MVAIATKVNGDTISATEFNQLPDELENVVTAGSGTPAAGTVDQVSKAIVDIVANADFYTDSGAADAYVLTATAPNKSPQSYRTGMKVRFRTSNANTGASVINVATLGSKNIKKQDGSSDPDAGDISDARENILSYDGTVFRIITELNEATAILKGIVELATLAEVQGDTGGDMVVTSDVLNDVHGVDLSKLNSEEVVYNTTFSAAATVAVTWTNDANFNSYKILLNKVSVSNDDAYLYLQVSTDGGSTWKSGAGNYKYSVTGLDDSGGSTDDYSNSATFAQITTNSGGKGIGNDTNEVAEFTVEFQRPDLAKRQIFLGHGAYYSTSVFQHVLISGTYLGGAEAINGIQFTPSAGTMSGNIKVTRS